MLERTHTHIQCEVTEGMKQKLQHMKRERKKKKYNNVNIIRDFFLFFPFPSIISLCCVEPSSLTTLILSLFSLKLFVPPLDRSYLNSIEAASFFSLPVYSALSFRAYLTLRARSTHKNASN